MSSVPQKTALGITLPECDLEKVAARFRSKLRLGDDGCLLYEGAPLHICRKRYSAIAVACEVAGLSTRGKYIVRTCESVYCVNLDHLLVMSLPDAVLYDGRKRFYAQVKKIPGRDTCWTWLGAGAGPQGYGSFTYDGRRWMAHQAALILEGIPPVENTVVCHECDNPRCVRPSHLFVGTQKQNMEDCSRKGRIGGMKLTTEQVLEIRLRLSQGESRLSVARRFNVSKNNIRAIHLRQTWQQC